jgi:hypothetical protein
VRLVGQCGAVHFTQCTPAVCTGAAGYCVVLLPQLLLSSSRVAPQRRLPADDLATLCLRVARRHAIVWRIASSSSSYSALLQAQRLFWR